MRNTKRIVSFLLSAIMVVTTFLAVGPVFTIEAEAADITLGGITQQRVVATDNDDYGNPKYKQLYSEYQSRFFNGAETNEPTDFVIPGLADKDNYTPQGMTYWAEKEWILISAYHAESGDKKKNSVIYALDAVTTDFVALFHIKNKDGTWNTSHGGGIAASKYNFYYADSASGSDEGSRISYIPLSDMDVAPGSEKVIQIKDSIDCGDELYGANTSYCCYDEGVLWAGNFHFWDDDRYNKWAHPDYQSMLVGYRLKGGSSEEEWHNLQDGNLFTPIYTGESTETVSGATVKSTLTVDEGGCYDIVGSITGVTSTISDYNKQYGKVKLEHGVDYALEFDASAETVDAGVDMYFLRDGGTGSYFNIQSALGGDLKRTQNSDGTYHYVLNFTPGEPVKNSSGNKAGECNWDLQENAGGEYYVRFDRDNVSRDQNFAITNIRVAEVCEEFGMAQTQDCAGNPTYAVAIDNQIDRIQYAMVDKGKIYISRSWSRYESANHIRELDVGDFDLNIPGEIKITVNNRNRWAHLVSLSDITRFGGGKGEENASKMLYMGEALCVIDDYLYIFGEGAAYNYRVLKSNGNTCTEPIDVIWKVDQYAIMGEQRPLDDVKASHYEKVNSLSQIVAGEEYLIVHESVTEDPVTQKKYLYALDSYGGYNGKLLPKKKGTEIIGERETGDSMGIVGYPIKTYTIDGNILKIDEEVDARKSIRWTIDLGDAIDDGQKKVHLRNSDFYFANNRNLYFDKRFFVMSSDDFDMNGNIRLQEVGDGSNFYINSGGAYYLWCNDGSSDALMNPYTNHYRNHGYKGNFVPNYEGCDEVAGTFHSDALKSASNLSGNLLGRSLTADEFDLGKFSIYKRVKSEYESVAKTRVYTNVEAAVQEDGTYDLMLETYAIGPRQYQQLEKERPTDFVFVVDTSGSMAYENPGFQLFSSFDTEAAIGKSVRDWVGNDSQGDIMEGSGNMYIRHTDGVMCRVGAKVQKDGKGKYDWGTATYYYYQRIYLYYTHPDTGVKYWFHSESLDTNGYWSTEETPYDHTIEAYERKANINNKKVYYGECYQYKDSSYDSDEQAPRIDNVRFALKSFITAISAEKDSSGNPMQHRVGIVQFGSESYPTDTAWQNSCMYTNQNTSPVAYTGANSISDATYKNGLRSRDQFSGINTIVDNITILSGACTRPQIGLDMAYKILENSDTDYLSTGDRNACVILITDGAPGYESGNSDTAVWQGANNAVMSANKIKNIGAYVYTVRIGQHEYGSFDTAHYLDCVSSEYIDAKSLTDVGTRNFVDVDFSIDVNTDSQFDVNNIAREMSKTVKDNSLNALDSLTADSVLKENINLDAFVIPVGTQPQVQTARSYYDGLGRMRFYDPDDTLSGVKADITREADGSYTVTATGFDYSKHNVADFNSEGDKSLGRKMIITLKGVLPAEKNTELTGDILNETIVDSDITGLYKNQDAFDSGKKFKGFPSAHLTIPQYTYYLDFGIDMLDIDINGTLKSVDTDIRQQNINSYTTSLASASGTELEFTNKNQDMLYKVKPGADGLQQYFVLIQRDSGKYDWFAINLIPASNIYYEESSLSETAGGTVDWTSVGSSGFYQTISGNNDLYGYDENYAKDTSDFSNGTHIVATTTSDNRRSKTKTFEFTGTGVDLYSACGTNTGVQVIAVRDLSIDTTQPNTNNLVKAYVVDTFYNDTPYGTLYQVPIMRFDGAYGNYRIETTATYMDFAGAVKFGTQSVESEIINEDGTVSYTGDFTNDKESAILKELGFEELIGTDVEFIWYSDDSVLNGGMGAQAENTDSFTTQSTPSLVNYIDGVRIYSPLGSSAVYHESEQNATYYNVINNLVGPGSIFTAQSGVGYIENNGMQAFNFAQYNSVGRPKDEVYLDNTGSLIFTIGDWTEDSRVMISARAAYGTPILNAVGFADTIDSKTEMYYDITSAVAVKGETAKVTIGNAGENSLLAIGNIKIVNAAQAPVPYSFESMGEIEEMLNAPVVEVDFNAPKFPQNDGSIELPVPEQPDNNEPDDGNDDIVPPSDDNNPEEPAEDGFFAKVESFFVKIFNFFKNIFNKVFSFFEF